MQRLNVYFLIYLTVSVSVINIATAKKVGSTAIRAGQLGGNCMKGLAESMPPDFCWKTGGDAGTIPTGCPDGYFRSAALCLEKCKSNYSWDGAFLCLEKCDSGYDTHPLTCYKNLFDWYGRDSYFQKSIDNFSDRVPCPEGKYKSGALCYRNCGVIGMINCGIGACSTDSGACAAAIVGIVVDVVIGMVDLIVFVVSMGTSSAMTSLKSSVKSGLKSIAQDGMKKAMKAAITSIKGKFTKIFIKIAIKTILAAIR